MNRTIKFRGKRPDNKGWAYGDFIHGVGMHYGNTYILPNQQWLPTDCDPLDGYEVTPDTVGQFTGLHDINGKEIYEGDILDTKTSDYCPNGYQFICKWIDSGFALIYQGMTYSEKRKNPWLNRYPLCKENVKDLCIIGNIYDNPELIKSDEPE